MAFVETKQSNHKNASTQLVWRGWQSNKLVINFQPTMERAGVGNWGGRVKTITNLEIILTRATELRAIDWMSTAIKQRLRFCSVFFRLLLTFSNLAVFCCCLSRIQAKMIHYRVEPLQLNRAHSHTATRLMIQNQWLELCIQDKISGSDSKVPFKINRRMLHFNHCCTKWHALFPFHPLPLLSWISQTHSIFRLMCARETRFIRFIHKLRSIT